MRARETWTGTGLELFPQVESALENLLRRAARIKRYDALIFYFHNGFTPLVTPNRREKRRGSAIVTPNLAASQDFLDFIGTFGEWNLLTT
jgi:hypothetical protein